MNIKSPSKTNFTVYSKNGCKYCDYVKNLFIRNNFIFYEINCDNYLKEDKDFFLNYIETISGKSYKTFPMVFYNGEFIGGFNETKNFVEKLNLHFDEF
jgi:glutaredoxin